MTTNPIKDIPCPECGEQKMHVEHRPVTVIEAKPLGSHSLSGNTLKVSAMEKVVQWPWAVCEGCGMEMKATR